MPLVWRYLLIQYLKVLTLSVTTFIAVLFISRFQQIAQFAALGASWWNLLLFAFCLIPYILPLAVPVSCLLSAVILFHRLSHGGELSSMRACGLSLRQITAPLLLASAALALGNFYIASELATHSYLVGRRMQNELASVNPLHLLQNSQILRVGAMYADMRTVSSGEEARDVRFALCNPTNQKVSLFIADKLVHDGHLLRGDNVSIITTLDEQQSTNRLMIENVGTMWTPSESFSHLFRTLGWRPKDHYLKLRLLLVRIQQARSALTQDSLGLDQSKRLVNQINMGYSEIARRASVALATFTFTLLGCAFGIDVGRKTSKKKLCFAFALSGLFVTSFVIGMSVDTLFALASLLFLGPHIVIVVASIWSMKRVSRGTS